MSAPNPVYPGFGRGELRPPGPPGRPSASGRGRRRPFAVVGAGAVVGLVGGLLLSTRDNGGPDESSANPPATAVAPPTTARPTAEEIAAAIEVVETGFTTGQVVACDSDAHGETTCPPEERQELGEQVSYAAIIENTSDQVITGALIHLRFLTATGEVVADSFEDSRGVPRLLPGQRLALGETSYRDGAMTIAHMEVEIEVSEATDWLPEAESESVIDNLPDDGELTTSDISVTYGEADEPIVAFSVESTYEQPINPGEAYVLFRNTAGDLIGGESGPLDESVPVEGQLQAEVPLSDPMEIPGIAAAQTEVYLGSFF